MKTFLAFIAIVFAVHANLGMDLSIYTGTVSQSDFQCLKGKGWSFMILEEYVEGSPASNFKTNYENALKAGIQEVDAYAFICNTCHGGQSATGTVSGIEGNLPSGFNGMIWLDIEPCSGCWSGNGETNFKFAQQIAQSLTAKGYNVGVYTSSYAWQSVMPGVSSTWFSKYPLWYPHYDNVESFNDPNSFKFNGWTNPVMK